MFQVSDLSQESPSKQEQVKEEEDGNIYPHTPILAQQILFLWFFYCDFIQLLPVSEMRINVTIK